MDWLKETVKQVVFAYAGGSPVVRTFRLADDENGVYAVNMIDWPKREQGALVVVLVRLDGDRVIVEEDNTDRPIVEALVRAGIPRERIQTPYLEMAGSR